MPLVLQCGKPKIKALLWNGFLLPIWEGNHENKKPFGSFTVFSNLTPKLLK